MKDRDVTIAAIVATVMQVEANDPRLPIVIDVVRSMDAMHRSQDRARAGRLGGQQTASKSQANGEAKAKQTASKSQAKPGLLDGLSTENHLQRTATQAVASPEGEGLGGVLVPVSSVSVSDPGPILSQPPISGDPQSDGRARRGGVMQYSSNFLSFWEAYPKKVGKGDAWERWRKDQPPLDRILAALAWQVGSERWIRDGGQYIPDPVRYLKRRHWEDERPAQTSLVDGRAPLSARERQNATAIEAFIARGGQQR